VAVSSFPLPAIPPALLCPPPVRLADMIWPLPGMPEPDLYKRGMTEAREVIRYFHGDTTEERVDALKHLVNICAIKAGGRYWSPRPYLKFQDAPTAKKDWENCDPYFPHLRRDATRGWFTAALPEHIDRYSPQHVTKRELLGLAAIKDIELLRVCNTLACDMFDEGEKLRRHELNCSTLVEKDGDTFYWDGDHEVAVTRSATPTFKPDYAAAVAMLVKDKALREALPRHVCQTLELVFRKLAAGVDATDIIAAVADAIHRDERTVRRDLARARDTANDLASDSSKLMDALAANVLPDNRAVAQSSPCRPQVDALAESVALQSAYTN
jgi:hypothetical protein